MVKIAHQIGMVSVVNSFADLALQVRREGRLAPEFDALRFRVGAVPSGAFHDAAAFELRGNPKDRKNDLGKIGNGIEERLGE